MSAGIPTPDQGRREFLSRVGGTAAVAAALTGAAPVSARDDDDFQHFRDMHRVSQRARDAFEVRLKAALFQMRRGTSQHRSNGDERRYENKIANPVVPDATGSTLVPYVGPSLTAGNEIDKLASNVAVGRAGPCGVHWRSDCDQGMFLGEACAIAALQDMRRTWKESFVGFRFKKFDGTMVTI